MAAGSSSLQSQNLIRNRPQSVWTQWLIPSVEDLYFVALFCLLVYTNLSSRLLNDAGTGWHIRTGQLIASTHKIPHLDPFSSSLNGRQWFAWEWLYDLVVGSLADHAGLNAVVTFAAFLIALAFSCALRILVRRRANIAAALILTLLATCASMIHFFARPHIVSWLFTVLWFEILDSCEVAIEQRDPKFVAANSLSRRKYLWLLPLIMLVWVNAHGGFLIGLVLLAIYWTGALWQWLQARPERVDDALLRPRAKRQLRNLSLIGVLSALATIVNPYGVNLYAHIYSYLSDSFLIGHIDEFQSPNFHYIAQKCFAALLLVTIAGLIAGVRRLRLSQSLIILFAIYAGLYASRNIPISSLLLVLVIGPEVSWKMSDIRTRLRFLVPTNTAGTSRNFFARMDAIELTLRGHVWPIAVLGFTGIIVASGGKLGSHTLIDARFSPQRFPVAAVDYIESRHLQGPTFAPDNWGGYLIYRLYPTTKLVVDDRHDFYGEAFLRSYLKLIHAEPGWDDFLREHPANILLVPRDSALESVLETTTNWRSVYEDDLAVVFVPGEKR